MKIIGKTTNGFILEATETEVANLCGYSSEYADRTDRPKVGAEIHVAAMYRHLYNLGSQKKEITAMAAKLRTAADLIDTLPDPITAAEALPDTPPT